MSETVLWGRDTENAAPSLTSAGSEPGEEEINQSVISPHNQAPFRHNPKFSSFQQVQNTHTRA